MEKTNGVSSLKCRTKGFECPYALSDESPLPCYATSEQCRDILALRKVMKRISGERGPNSSQNLKLGETQEPKKS